MAENETPNEGKIVDKIYTTIAAALDAALDNERDNTVAMSQLAMAEQAARTLGILDKLGYEEDDSDTEDDF